jgi:hypothetical protein
MLLVLDSTSRTLRATMADPADETECSVTVTYADTTATTFVEGMYPIQMDGTNFVTILPAPASGTRRVVKSVMFFNDDTMTHTVTLYLTDNITDYPITKITLPAGASWASDDQTGVNVGGAVTDGSKGDIAVSSGGDTWTINNGVVTLAKLADLPTDRLIGRDSTGTGVPEAISVTGGIEFTGSGSIQVGAFSGDVAKTAGSATLTISNDAVTTSKMGGDVTTAGKALLDDADAAAQRTTLGLGTFATRNVMANTNISPTSADQTGAVNTRYFATIAGLSNHRDFTLPTPAIGDEIELSIVDGDDLYSLVIVPSSSSITINNGRAAISVTADSSTDTFTATKHGLINGDPVRFGGTTLPSNITAGTMYYVRDAAADTFKVASGRGDAAVNFTTNGSGVTFTPQEWSRLFIKGEYIRLVANSTTNWQVVVDGRIPQAAELERTTGLSGQSLGDVTGGGDGAKLTVDTEIADNASIADPTTSTITPRRTGSYLVSAGARVFTGGGALSFWQTYIRTSSSSPVRIYILDNRGVPADVYNTAPASLVTGTITVPANQALQYQGYQVSGNSRNIHLADGNRVVFSILEILK